MNRQAATSDELILDQIRRTGKVSVSELVAEVGVTATAIRQRLNRLMAEGLVQRQPERGSRGRPNHRYSLTRKGERRAGNNYGDLAQVLWEELRSIRDPEVRQGLLRRIVTRLAGHYKKSIQGDTIEDRTASVVKFFDERDVPLEVDESGELPVLTALACPYPDLAEQDRGICAMEKMLFSELIGSSMQLTSCRLDGATCCTFQGSSA